MNVLKLFSILDIKLFCCNSFWNFTNPSKAIWDILFSSIHIMYHYSKIQNGKYVVATSTVLLFFQWKTQILHLLKSLRISFPFIGMKSTFLCVKEFDSLILLFSFATKTNVNKGNVTKSGCVSLSFCLFVILQTTPPINMSYTYDEMIMKSSA